MGNEPVPRQNTIRPRDSQPALTAAERRSVGSLAAIYASRMLGMFLMLPVLSLHAETLADYSPQLLGLAMGAYGLTQALLQIPFGRWSDRHGRKPMITLGLALYALGSLVGMLAHSVTLIAVARAIQGAGAVSASVTALLADLTRDEVRTRSMALIGISIGLSFVISLIAAPVLDAAIGVPGIFGTMLAMALLGIVLLHWAVPAEPQRSGGVEGREFSGLLDILTRPALMPLYFGMFAMQFGITATFISVPQVLEHDLGMPGGTHWQVYLGVFLASIVLTVPLVLRSERGRGRRAAAIYLGSIVVMGGVQAALGFDHQERLLVLAALTLYFAVFNYLEAALPAMLTLAAPAADRGAALGIFATAQFLGAFFGGVIGGLLLGRFGLSGVFWGCAAVAAAWALVALRTGGHPGPPVSA
ncbi:MAG: MFS transporter [Steroidobacteraceae bacterium]